MFAAEPDRCDKEVILERMFCCGHVILPTKCGHSTKRVSYRKAEVNHDQETQEDNGVPSHDRGVSPDAELYYLGLPFLHSARSSFFWGVGDDASFIAEHLVSRGQGV
mgnify:CR=1 FL=1|jgi:hypothetical protein